MKVLFRVSKHKKAVMGIMEKIPLDKIYSGMNYNAVHYESKVTELRIYME